MKDKFPDMENFTCVTQVTPSVYGYVNISSLIGRNNSNRVIRMHRRLEYMPAYSPIRDHFYAGMNAIYLRVLELLQNQTINNGDLKRYWVVGVETANDIPRRVLSFDMRIFQADTFEKLCELPEFQAIPGINDKKLHSVVYPYGMHYEYDMESIKYDKIVFHLRAYRYNPTPLDAFDLDKFTFDMESKECINFVNASFSGMNRELHSVGMTMEYIDGSETTTVPETPSLEVKDESSDMEIRDPAGLAHNNVTIAKSSQEDDTMLKVEPMNIDEVMGKNKNTKFNEITNVQNKSLEDDSEYIDVIESN